MQRLTVLLLVSLGLSGCTGDGADDDGPAAPIERTTAGVSPNDPWAEGNTEAVLIDVEGATIETDVPCLNSYAIEHERTTDWWVAEGTDRVVIEYAMFGANTGYQVGYAFAGGDIIWGETVPPTGAAEIVVPVGAEQIERDAQHWRFYHRMNIPVVEPDCYAGGGESTWSLKATAYPA